MNPILMSVLSCKPGPRPLVALIVATGMLCSLACFQVHADGSPALAVRKQYVAGSSNDPQLRLARYQYREKLYFSSAATLQTLEITSPEVRQAATFHRQLANSKLAFGLPGTAEYNYREAIPVSGHPLILTHLQLRLANQLFAHARYTAALALLKAIHHWVGSRGMQSQWQAICARVYLAMGREQDAIRVLQLGGSLSPYARYNLAVALLHSGKTEKGLSELNRVATTHASGDDEKALRDKANLVLGDYYLRQKNGRAALPILQRVRMTGPYSNRALLAMGWAEMAIGDAHRTSQSATQPSPVPLGHGNDHSGLLGEIANRLLPKAFLQTLHLKLNPANGKSGLLRALVPWSLLLQRDPLAPAVQEASITVPYALEKIGAIDESRLYYEKAVINLQHSLEQLQQARSETKSGRLIQALISHDPDKQAGWFWSPTLPHDTVGGQYLYQTIAGRPYQKAMQNLHDLRFLQDELDTLAARLSQLEKIREVDTIESPTGAATTAGSTSAGQTGTSRIAVLEKRISELQPAVHRTLGNIDQRLQRITLQALNRQQTATRYYLLQAHLALARFYGRSRTLDDFTP